MARKTQGKQCKAMQMELSPSTLLFWGGTSTRDYEPERGRTVKKSSNGVAAGEGEGSVRAQTYGPALLNINYLHAESLSMRMDRNLGINAFLVELLEVVALFEILANVNGIGGVYRHSRRGVQTDCSRQFCHTLIQVR